MSSIAVVILDDDAFLLKVLQRTIHRAYPEVDIMTTSDIDEFWQLLNTKQDLDLVLSDYLMPQMNGLDVLEQCSSQNPYPVRALLTGDMTLSTMMRQPNVVHAYLAKPFNEADITALFNNVAALKSLPFAFNVRRQLGAMISFPVYPLILKELRELVQSDEFDLHDIAHVVSQEPIITAKLLQLANSSYLGFVRPTSSIDEAVSRLGTTILMAITTSLLVAKNFESSIPSAIHEKQLDIAANYASCVKRFAKQAGFNLHDQELLFSVALLSFVGKIILLSQGESEASFEHEKAVSEEYASSNFISAYVLKLWGYDTKMCSLLMSCHDLAATDDNELIPLNHTLFIVRQILFDKHSPMQLRAYCDSKGVDPILCHLISEFDWHSYTS
ncbi:MULTISPECIES: HDOD domain-containing protein [unclassified Pseudoalteromonas]|jgi:HD-like signal output (HDOD) protein/CheY-like chemotaxis protein|uniref:HDOD domain-containing protein n=2 Tax=Pseudoalteromonas TaxID=53246 RepID=UPI00051A81C9|nr:HDOD domain-containing protein [Pseudoalteromonas sp. ND6B]KGK01130.1 response regulator receiver modulated metal dependent hydrolase [Pseudoalteromonas sp. ND6B]